MPKILQICIEVNSGSVGRIAEQIGEKIIEEGWGSYITFARNNLPSKSKVIQIGDQWDIYNHVLSTRVFDNHCFSSKNATRKLIAQIELIDPDIIHLHHLHGYFINIEILFNYLEKSNKPIVWTFHDCWSFTGHCAYFEYVGCDKWITGCYKCEQQAEYPKSFIFDRSKQNYLDKNRIFNSVENMVIVSVSHWLGDLVKRSFLKNYPVNVIQNGIDINVFSPKINLNKIREKYKIDKSFIILGVASTWEKRKGLDYFVELDKLIPDTCEIVVVGLSKKQVTQLPKSIIGIERTENVDDLASLYSLADVFVNPTLEDTFPTTNLESLACGTPVITFETGGSVESVNGETGLIVPKEDVKALLCAVEIIISNTKAFYTKKCRQRAVELYDKNLNFEEYIRLYRKMLII
jgi:putative colanic acid biosynthesis glycosyltransferase